MSDDIREAMRIIAALKKTRYVEQASAFAEIIEFLLPSDQARIESR